MFNTPRWHRLLTVPALVVVLGVFCSGPAPLYALAVFPPAFALPWILHAALRRSDASIGGALTAIRVVGYLGVAWSLFVMLASIPAGAIMLAGMSGLLLTAGASASEPRLAGAVMLAGGLLVMAGLPLLWIGYGLVIPAGVLMFAGGTWWLAESVRHPVATTLAPELPLAVAL